MPLSVSERLCARTCWPTRLSSSTENCMLLMMQNSSQGHLFWCEINVFNGIWWELGTYNQTGCLNSPAPHLQHAPGTTPGLRSLSCERPQNDLSRALPSTLIWVALWMRRLPRNVLPHMAASLDQRCSWARGSVAHKAEGWELMDLASLWAIV